MIGDKYEIYTFNYLMTLALSQVPNTMDKRQGSIIYDALAPACHRLAEVYQNIRNVYKDTYAQTSQGVDLDYRVSEQGIKRYPATYAVKKAYVVDGKGEPMSVPIGARFSTLSDINPITYRVISVHTEGGDAAPGYYQLECEVAGYIGNEYAGTLVQITNIRGIGSATMSTLLVPGRDEETDDELRARYFEALNNKSYGGNIAQYREQVGAISGVGGVQIYPVWNGGGTVKISIIDSQKNICTPEFIDTVQNQVDPENSSGEHGTGLGLAPIGHKVTVSTPAELSIQVDFSIKLIAGYELDQLKESIKKSVDEYFYELRTKWDEPNSYGEYSLSIYRSRISANILAVAGVANVADLTLNGQDADIVLTQTGLEQQIPKLGDIIIDGVII